MFKTTSLGNKWGAIAAELSGIFHFYPSFRTDPDVAHAHAAAHRLAAQRGSDRKAPITVQILSALRAAIRSKKQEPALALRDWSFYLLAFLGLFRGSELVALRWPAITWTDAGVRITLTSSKTDQYYRGAEVSLPRNARAILDPGTLLRRMYDARVSDGFVFAKPDGSPLQTDTFRGRFKRYLSDAAIVPPNAIASYSLHSFRRGGATAMAQRKIPVRVIMRHGRWVSDAVNVYMEAADDEPLQATAALGAALV